MFIDTEFSPNPSTLNPKLKIPNQGGVWDDQHGDRQQEIVFIGTELDRERVTAAMDSCLLTDEEMAGQCTQIPNPKPETL